MLILVGIVCFIVASGFISAAAVIHTGKPRLSRNQIKEILEQYQDDHGEFHFHECAAAIEERLNP